MTICGIEIVDEMRPLPTGSNPVRKNKKQKKQCMWKLERTSTIHDVKIGKWIDKASDSRPHPKTFKHHEVHANQIGWTNANQWHSIQLRQTLKSIFQNGLMTVSGDTIATNQHTSYLIWLLHPCNWVQVKTLIYTPKAFFLTLANSFLIGAAQHAPTKVRHGNMHSQINL